MTGANVVLSSQKSRCSHKSWPANFIRKQVYVRLDTALSSVSIIWVLNPFKPDRSRVVEILLFIRIISKEIKKEEKKSDGAKKNDEEREKNEKRQ